MVAEPTSEKRGWKLSKSWTRSKSSGFFFVITTISSLSECNIFFRFSYVLDDVLVFLGSLNFSLDPCQFCTFSFFDMSKKILSLFHELSDVKLLPARVSSSNWVEETSCRKIGRDKVPQDCYHRHWYPFLNRLPVPTENSPMLESRRTTEFPHRVANSLLHLRCARMNFRYPVHL